MAPFHGNPIGGAVVFVFTSTLKNRLEDSCDTAAMEIAHAYGLDHSFHCRDVMTYKKRCGTRRFVDEDTPCGEDEPRTCTGGAKTQNSHKRLASLLGSRNGKRVGGLALAIALADDPSRIVWHLASSAITH